MSNSNNSNDTLMGILSYIGILVLIPIIAAKDSPFAKFHANQGLILFIVEVALSILSWIPIVQIISWIGYVLVFVFSILGIINAAKGEMKPLPIIGQFKILH